MRFKHDRLGDTAMLSVTVWLHMAAILFSVIASCDKGAHRGVVIESQRMAAAAEALYLFRAEYNRFPTTEEGLRALVRPPSTESFLSTIPTDAWGTEYNYRYEDGQAIFRLWSNGPDRKPGGGDDIHWSPSPGRLEERIGQE